MVKAADLGGHLSRLERERRLAGWIDRSALLKKILKPLH